jgi:hypothetical protein
MRYVWLLLILALMVGCGRTVTKPTPPPPVTPPSPPAPPPPPAALEALKVSGNGRFLETTSGQPFFMVGDTNWALIGLQSREEVTDYLANRRAKGFNAVLTTTIISIVQPNRYGHYPFEFLVPSATTDQEKGYDFSKPIEAYWTHLDFVVEEATKAGLYVLLTAAWSNYLGGHNGVRVPLAWDTTKASNYGKFLGGRYKGKSIIWVAGGDDRFDLPCPFPTGCSVGNERKTWWEAIVAGIRETAPAALVTFHPSGGLSSSDVVGDASWLSFHAHQSGHVANYFNTLVPKDYIRAVVKPVIDIEPLYEDNPFWDTVNGGWTNTRPDEAQVRRIHYWNATSGAAGVVFGNLAVAVYHMDPNDFYSGGPSTIYPNAINAAGSVQMGHLAKLMRSRPFHQGQPDTSIVLGSKGSGITTLTALVAPSFAFVFVPNPRPVQVDLSKLGECKAWWFNPTSGEATSLGSLSGTPIIAAPSFGPDAVLVLDQASKNYGPPGQ